jgi:hypothetical protein
MSINCRWGTGTNMLVVEQVKYSYIVMLLMQVTSVLGKGVKDFLFPQTIF